jgi:molybdenum cofactor synthesis domain-containing protein
MIFKTAVVTVSDRGYRSERQDRSGQAIQERLSETSFEVVDYRIVPDEKEEIHLALTDAIDRLGVDLVLTTGGTGLSPRDVTPDATSEVIEKEVPGFAEAMRAESMKKTPHAMISRALCGARKSSLIINLPGSPKRALKCLDVILPALPHALSKLKGDPSECGDPRSS